MKILWRGSVALGMIAVLALGRSTASQANPFEEVVKQILSAMDQLSTTLATVRDEESAQAARPDLRKIAGQWQEIRKKSDSLPPPSKEAKEQLEKTYKAKLEAAQKKLFGEIARVQLVPGGRDALTEISAVLGKKSK